MCRWILYKIAQKSMKTILQMNKIYNKLIQNMNDLFLVVVFILKLICFIWDKVFKNGPSKICGRQPLKNLKGYGLLPFKFLKGYHPQILLGPSLNTLSHLCCMHDKRVIK